MNWKCKRTSSLLRGILLGCLWLQACGAADDQEPSNPLRHDERISKWFSGGRLTYYDRDTQDMGPILVQKLKDSGGDPLRRAKEELGQMGSEAALLLRRLFDENFTNQKGIPFLENAVDAASLNPSQEAHDLLFAGLEHPMEAVRRRCLTGISTQHAQAQDFDDLKRRFETHDTLEIRQQYLRAMFKADRARAEQAALEWIQRGDQEQFMQGMIAGLEGSSRPESGLICGVIYTEVPVPYASQLAAIAARFGDANALAYVRSELVHEDASRQARAAIALGSVGLYSELKPAISARGQANVRLMALQGLSTGARDNPEIQAWMATGLFDPNAKVRDYALSVLCKVNYPPALDQALAQLKGNVELLQPALQALRDPLAMDPELAARALEILTRRYAEEVAASDELHGRTLKAIGQVPGRASAEFLRRRALELAGLEVEGMQAHSWIMIAASNTGPEGMRYLHECLADERDALRRIDLIDAIASVGHEVSREWLFDLLEAAEDPYEAFFIAISIIQMGPARLVASRLQAYCYRLEHVETRQALQAMLWKWY